MGLKNKGSKTKVKIFIAIIIISIVGATLYRILQNRQNQTAKITRLNASNKILSMVRSKLSSDVSSTPSNSCYRTAEKFGNGWIVCQEELEIIAGNRTNSEIISGITRVIDIINTSDNFEKIDSGKFTVFSNYQDIHVIEALQPTSPNISNCKIELDAFSANHAMVNKRGSYAIKISCYESHLSSNIYN